MKIKNILMALIILLGMSLNVSAATLNLSSQIPSDWEIYTEEATVTHQNEDGEPGVMISCETDGGISMAAVTTGKIDLSGDFTLSLRMKLSDDGGKSVRIMYLNDEVPVITLTGTTVTVFDLADFNVEADTLFDLDISYDEDAKTARVWVDGELKAEGVTDSVTGNNKKSSDLTISSYIMSETASADWFFSKIISLSGNNPKITTYPISGEAVFAEAVENAYVDFGVLTSYATKNGGTVRVYKNGTEESAKAVREETKIIITPDNGFLGNCNYKIVLEGGSDVFGNDKELVKIEFRTVSSNYLAPSVSIIKPENGRKLLAGEEIGVEIGIEKGSEEIVKAELSEDGKTIKSTTEEPYSFTYLGDVGEHTITVSVTDAAGVVTESEEIKVNVLENSAPVITILNASANAEVLMNNNLKISVSDKNDNIDYVKAYLGGVELDAISDTEFEYPETIPLGMQTLSVLAYDTAGAVGRREVKAYFTRAEIETEVVQDMTKYTAQSSDAAWPAGIYGSLYKDSDGKIFGYVEADERDGKKAMALGAEENSKGKSSYFGITWLGGTEMPKEQFTCSMDIWFDDINSQFNSVLRPNKDSPASSEFSQKEVIFKDGTLTIHDGGSAVKTVSYEANKWYTLKLEYNIKKGTYSCWLDGEQLADNYALQVAVPNVSLLRFHYAPTTADASELCISNFEVYDITTYPYLVSTDADANGMPLDAKDITAMFNKETGTAFVLEKAQIFAGNGEKAVESYLYSGELSAVAAKMLDYPVNSTEYQLLVSGKYNGFPMKSVISFKSAAGGFDAYNTGFTTSSEGVSFFADIQNDSGEEQNVLVLIIKYEDGIMTDSQSTEAKIDEAGARISTPAVKADGKAVEIIAVIWDSWASRKPINNNIYTYQN